jgi:hypothetical protein
MSRLAQRLLWGALALALVMGVAFDLSRKGADASRIHRIPAKGFGFHSFEIPLSQGELARYKQAEVIKRCYVMGASRFILVAIDGERNRHAVHDPMYCFTGSGWRIVSTESMPIEAGSCTVLHLMKGAVSRDVAYWFTDGRKRHASVVRYWLQATLRRITMGRFGQEPVLVMIQSIEGSPVNLTNVMNQLGALFEI